MGAIVEMAFERQGDDMEMNACAHAELHQLIT